MKLKWLISLLLLWLALPLSAQEEPALLALRTDTTALQTGEFYTIRVEMDHVSELWSTTMTIDYDPQHIYVVGTKSGSPVKLGDFMAGGAVIIHNQVSESNAFVRFTPSRLAPADPVSGSGVIGTFQIVPLLAGEVTLSFRNADVSRVIFKTDEAGQRLVQEAFSIPFAVTQLTLTITGDPATPPPEVTATPTATATLDPAVVRSFETEEATSTLVVVTDAASAPYTTAAPQATGVPLLLIIAVALIAIGIIGLIILALVMRRSGTKTKSK